MATSAAPAEQTIEMPACKFHLLHAGAGNPLIILHHDIGSPGWLPLYEELATRASVYVPDLPGYGASERPEWARHPRDLAVLCLQLLNHLGLEGVTLVGLGFGGWLAAEMATMDSHRFHSLVLVGAFGLKPQHAAYADQMLMSHIDYVKAGFRNETEFGRQFGAEPSAEQSLAWDLNKEMTARIAWKPYMFSRQLPHLLKAVETPVLVVWGSEDCVAPVECGELYAATLPNGRLMVLEDTGHFVDMERPQELAGLIFEHSGLEAQERLRKE